MEKQERKEMVFEALKSKMDEASAMECAERCAELIEKMKDGIVSFSFMKSDGTERAAMGTVCPDLLPPPPEYDGDKPKRERTPNYGIVNYYDTEKQSWRCFKAENLISFEKGGAQ